MRIILSLFFALAVFNVKADPGNETTLTWGKVLARIVDSNGMVDYNAAKNDAEFKKVIQLFSSQHPDESWTKEEAMAFWINVYNAYTIKLVAENLPLKSIKDIGDPWDIKFIELQGKTYSLNQIEHEILRPVYKDPRIHFAVNCASFSCPKIPRYPMTAEKLDMQLNKLSSDFLRDTDRNSISSSSMELSQIFTWFESDFGGKKGVIDFINTYGTVKVDASAKVTYQEYDWSLNAQ